MRIAFDACAGKIARGDCKSIASGGGLRWIVFAVRDRLPGRSSFFGEPLPHHPTDQDPSVGAPFPSTPAADAACPSVLAARELEDSGESGAVRLLRALLMGALVEGAFWVGAI
jgi:hypothetical protein